MFVISLLTSSEHRLIKLLRSAKSPAVRDVTIEWTAPSKLPDDFELILEPEAAPKPVTKLFNPEHKDETISSHKLDTPTNPVVLSAFEAIQKSPLVIPSIYSGSRTVIYAILSNATAPKEVMLRAKTDAGDKLELVVPVIATLSTSLSKISTSKQIPLIHTLSARKLLADLEEGKTYDQTAVARAKMVRLGIMYNLASKYTSFVAVESNSDSDAKDSKEKRPKKQIVIPTRVDRGGGQDLQSLDYLIDRSAPLSYSSPLPMRMSPVRKSRSMVPSLSSFLPKFMTRSSAGPSPVPPPPLPMMKSSSLSGGERMLWLGRATLSQVDATMSDSVPTPAISAPTPLPGMMQTMKELGMQISSNSTAGETFSPSSRLVAPGQQSFFHQTDTSEVKLEIAASNDDQRARLVCIQAFDGSFPSVAYVCSIIGITAPTKPTGVQDNVWATSIALAWLQKKCSDQKDEWEVIATKAEAFVAGVLHGDALLAVQKAANALF